jgi:hypothetical protein
MPFALHEMHMAVVKARDDRQPRAINGTNAGGQRNARPRTDRRDRRAIDQHDAVLQRRRIR